LIFLCGLFLHELHYLEMFCDCRIIYQQTVQVIEGLFSRRCIIFGLYCKMRSEINVFDVKCESDNIPCQYLRFFVRIVICIVGKLSICKRFWIEEKSIYNFYMRKQAEGKLTLQVCFSVSHVACLLASLLDKASNKITVWFFP